MHIYVLSADGKPLMPTTPARARKKLRDGKAKVVNREPFTIQLTYLSTTYVQPVTLGVDAGSKTVGLSASTAKKPRDVYSKRPSSIPSNHRWRRAISAKPQPSSTSSERTTSTTSSASALLEHTCNYSLV